jgi:hypothetical protein
MDERQQVPVEQRQTQHLAEATGASMINFCFEIVRHFSDNGGPGKNKRNREQKSSIIIVSNSTEVGRRLRDTVPLRGNNHFHNSPGQYLRQISNNIIRDGVFALSTKSKRLKKMQKSTNSEKKSAWRVVPRART